MRSLRAARSLAEPARGLCATSPAEGMIARRASSAASASRPQPQTGISGGQIQPRARSVPKRFTRRSSSEWKEMPATTPPSDYDAYSPGGSDITLWKGFQRNHASGLQLLQAQARSP